MSDGLDRISAATGLKVGVSSELRRFFEMSQDPAFIRQHNERLARRWDLSKPDHAQIVYVVLDVIVWHPNEESTLGVFKRRDAGDPVALHHQFYYQAEKEIEYWCLKHLDCKIEASIYARHYRPGADGDVWVLIDRRTTQVTAASMPAVAANEAKK